VLHGTLPALARKLQPIVLMNARGALRLDAERAQLAQSLDQLGKVAARRRISGLAQPRQRALSAADADLEQFIQSLTLPIGQPVSEPTPQLSLRTRSHRTPESFNGGRSSTASSNAKSWRSLRIRSANFCSRAGPWIAAPALERQVPHPSRERQQRFEGLEPAAPGGRGANQAVRVALQVREVGRA
jgi:hypothetical protein